MVQIQSLGVLNGHYILIGCFLHRENIKEEKESSIHFGKYKNFETLVFCALMVSDSNHINQLAMYDLHDCIYNTGFLLVTINGDF